MIPVNSRILYKSEVCIVINKLKGESVEGFCAGAENLTEKLSLALGNTELIEAVHRLDVPVTGCVLFALTKTSLSFLNNVFAGKTSMSVEKKYWAVVEKPAGFLPEKLNSFTELVHWIETNPKKNKSFVYDKDGPGRKKASLRYRITGEGLNYLFLEIETLTGRHHQIRAQLAGAGFYIKGDLKYGAKRSEKNGGIRLHASSLSFPDPLNKKGRIFITADPPENDNLWNSFKNSYSSSSSTSL
jgi:23S rRNA pseudouridine1911/1915/1917 synthase